MSKWDEWNSTGGPKYPLTPLVQFVFREFNLRSEKIDIRALDLGCGSGVHTEFLSSNGFDTYGIDSSSVAVENSRKRLASRNLLGNIQIGDISNIPYPSGFFDLIVCVSVLDCVPLSIFNESFREINRLLSDNGKCFLYFCGEGDFRITNTNHLDIRAVAKGDIVAAIERSGSERKFELDVSMQTYKNGTEKQFNHVVTLR